MLDTVVVKRLANGVIAPGDRSTSWAMIRSRLHDGSTHFPETNISNSGISNGERYVPNVPAAHPPTGTRAAVPAPVC
jgi:hypothetical protein